MKVDTKLVLLAVSSVIVLLIGTLGFYQISPERGVLTAFYLAIQLFSMNSGIVEEVPTPPLIEVSRWLALGTLLIVVYAVVKALLEYFGSAFRIAAMKDHAIVCGAGQRGEALAKRLSESYKVIVIEADEACPSLGELRNQSIEVVIGNAIDDSVLKKAAVSRARILIAVTGADETNLAICTEVSMKLSPNCDTSAGLESWAWRNYFLDRIRPESKIRLASFLSRATHSLMLRLALTAARQPNFRKDGVRILIEASGDMQHELVRSAILMLQISVDKKPRLELTSSSVEQRAVFLERFPEVNLVAEVSWHTQSATEVFPEGCDECLDFAVFALETEIETLEATERFWMRHDVGGDRVIACLRGNNDATYIESVQKKPGDFTVENLLPLGLGKEYPLDPDVEEKANLCHTIYFKNEKVKNPEFKGIKENWRELPERLRESNRLAARHNEIKKAIWQTRGEVSPSEMLRFLSQCEHMRWMAEKVMDGWRWTGTSDKASRDNLKLKHHLLIPFDALTNQEVEKDYAMFLWALDLSDSELQTLTMNEDAQRMLHISQDCLLNTTIR